jgi:hypothetical protein
VRDARGDDVAKLHQNDEGVAPVGTEDAQQGAE